MLIHKKSYIFLSLIFSLCLISPVRASFDNHYSGEPYQAIPGLIDIRSTFSDGAHSIEELVRMARSKGFRLLFINDHDRIALSYGILPFRNIFRIKKEFPSIQTHGPEKFLQEIDRVSRMYPDMIVIPGCETSAYYYWTGSYFNDDLTAHDYDKRIIIVNFNNPDDYNHIPNLHNKLSLKYTGRFLPLTLMLLCPFFIGLLLITCKGIPRIIGAIVIIISVLAIADHNPFRSSMFTQYDGDQGIAPYQALMDYVNERGGFTFWNYPEQLSGIRDHGPVHVHTPPYPEVLYQSKRYTGFAAIYGDNIKTTEPGMEWDRVLNEYCRGERERPPWGISTADFHEEGRLGLKLGSFPTTFLIKGFSKEAVLEAMEKGRMYCSRGDGKIWPKLDYFTISGNGEEVAVMGETLTTAQYPLIKFRISYDKEDPGPMTVFLIRGGEVIQTIDEKPPFSLEYLDYSVVKNKKTYYRIMDSKKHLMSNPIFMVYNPK